jgi:hypothetical protein
LKHERMAGRTLPLKDGSEKFTVPVRQLSV